MLNKYGSLGFNTALTENEEWVIKDNEKLNLLKIQYFHLIILTLVLLPLVF